jgi:mono/diheme cytochrome c family protein
MADDEELLGRDPESNFLPGVIARTAAAMALAGVYALWTASRSTDGVLKGKIAEYAIVKWIAPMTIVLPLSLVWLLAAAAGAGVPVNEIFGASPGRWGAALGTIVGGSTTGQPIAQLAARVLLAACLSAIVLCGIVLARRRHYGRPLAAAMMLCAFAALGAAEWVREDLRKPYVIGSYMFVNGVRLPSDAAVAQPPDPVEPDRFNVDALDRTGLLPAALWTRLPAGVLETSGDARALAEGAEIFRLQCSTCHTIDGYMAIRPLVRKASPTTLDATIRRLAVTEGDVAWSTPGVTLRSWRNRRMPPFVGTRDERRDLAVYLARLGGAEGATLAAFDAEHAGGARFFEDNCSMCHGPDGDFPFNAKGRSADTFYGMIGRLPTINDAMPPLEATDVERRALAEYLATLTKGKNTEALR